MATVGIKGFNVPLTHYTGDKLLNQSQALKLIAI